MSEPRGLSKEAAAEYCGLSLAGFADWVAKKRLPGPIPGTKRWDRKAIDLALDRASGLQSLSPFEEWRQGGQGREGSDARS